MSPKSNPTFDTGGKVFDLEAQAGRVSGPSGTFTLTHKWAGLFFQLLLERAAVDEVLTLAHFEFVFTLLNPQQRTPDNTGKKRILDAVERVLQAMASADKPHLHYAARSRSTGPWSLQNITVAHWTITRKWEWVQLEHIRTATLVSSDAVDAHQAAPSIAQALAHIHHLRGKSQYADALDHIERSLSDLRSCASAEVMLLLQLKRVQVLRHLGRNNTPEFAQLTYALQTQAQAAAKDPSRVCPLLVRYILAQLALADARRKFDVQPNTVSEQLHSIALPNKVSTSPCPFAQIELLNLQALALRRKWQAHKPTQDTAQLQQQNIDRTQGAYFWAAVAEHAWWQQTVAINMAYLYSRQYAQEANAATLAASLNWYAFSNWFATAWHMPPDSSWYAIMLGTFYLDYPKPVEAYLQRNPQVAAQFAPDQMPIPHTTVRTNTAKKPHQQIYESALDLAYLYGEERQKILAHNMFVRYAKEQGSHYDLSTRAALITKHRNLCNQLLHDNPILAEDMVKDGFVGA